MSANIEQFLLSQSS